MCTCVRVDAEVVRQAYRNRWPHGPAYPCIFANRRIPFVGLTTLTHQSRSPVLPFSCSLSLCPRSRSPVLSLRSPFSLSVLFTPLQPFPVPERVTLAECSALTEKIVAALPKLRCPLSLEPHQIQGLDNVSIFPVVQWLVKKALETREEMQVQQRNSTPTSTHFWTVFHVHLSTPPKHTVYCALVS